MNLGELRRRARIKLGDRVVPPLWSDEEIDDALNEAVQEANLRARFFIDSTTPEVVQIPVQAGIARYDLHPAIIVVRRAEFAADSPGWQPRALRRRSFDELDRQYPQWRSVAGSIPHTSVQDLDERAITLTPIPTVAGVLRLTVWRHALDAQRMDSDFDEPAIPGAHHSRLVDWACFQLYSNDDAEERDEGRMQLFYNTFEAEFGKRPDAQKLRQLAVDHEPEAESYWY